MIDGSKLNQLKMVCRNLCPEQLTSLLAFLIMVLAACGQVKSTGSPDSAVSTVDAGVVECEGGGDNCTLDCAGTVGGTAEIDECGECTSEPCVTDCAGTAGGTAEIDKCGECTPTPCVQDCSGNWGGALEYDDCGNCVGNNSTLCPKFDYYVDAVNGLDTNDGHSKGASFKTITKALESATATSNRIHVAPGIYSSATESMPVTLPEYVLLSGNIVGRGQEVATAWATVGATVIQGAMTLNSHAQVKGFTLESTNVAVTIEGASVLIESNTFLSGKTGVYVGRLYGEDFIVANNEFRTTNYGIQAETKEAKEYSIDGNQFFVAAMPMKLNVAGSSGSIRNNTIVGTGQVGVQITDKARVQIESNTFSNEGGYSYGCVNARNGSLVTFRSNHCNAGEQLGIKIAGAKTRVDLGTATSLGKNSFTGTNTSTFVEINSSNQSTVTAFGNTWNDSNLLNCDNIDAGNGVLVWGADNGTCE